MAMAEEYEIVDVGEMLPNPEHPCWYVTKRKADGTLHGHVFPKATLEWRAAEYGLDDPAEILDVILHEGHRPRAAGDDRVSLVNPPKQAARAEAEEPVTLWTATSTGEAREAHRATIAAIKTKIRVVDPAGHLAHILSRHGMDPDRIREKAQRVDTTRWIKQHGGLPVQPTTEEATRA